MACTRLTGKALYVEFNSQALDAHYQSFEWDDEMGLEEMTAGDDTEKCYVATHGDGSATWKGLFDATDGETILTACAKGTEDDLIWGNEGNGTGKVSRTVNAISKSIAHSIPYDGAIEITIEFQFSGAITKGTFA